MLFKNPLKSLQSAFFILVLPLLSIITLSIFFTTQWTGFKNHQDLLVNKLRYEFHKADLLILNPMWNVNEARVNSIFDLILEDDDIIGLSIFDENDILFASKGMITGLNKNDVDLWISKNPTKDLSLSSYINHVLTAIGISRNKQEYYSRSDSIYFEISNNNKIRIGTLYLILSDKNQNTQIYKEINNILIIFLSILTAISLSIAFSYRVIIGKPLLTLKNSIIDALKGQNDTPEKIDYIQQNELVFLKSTFEELWNNQKELENDLISDRKYYQELFDALPIGLALTTIDGKIIDTNIAFTEIIGYTKDETLKLTYWEITPDSEHDQEVMQLELLRLNRTFGPYEKEYIHKSGKLIPVSLNGRLIKRDGVEYIWASIEDITERKRIELDLKKNRELLNETSKIAKIGGWDFDILSNKLNWTEELYNIHEVEYYFIPDMEKAINFYHSDSIPLIKDAINRAINFGESFKIECQIITGKNNHIWVIARGNAIKENGRIIKIRGTFQDITELIKSEIEKSKLQGQLNHKSKMDSLGQIAGGVAHDFNNLLSGITGAAELMQMQETDLSIKGYKYLDIILKASENAANLTDKLLAFSRKNRLDIKAINAQSIIEETVEFLENTLDKKIRINLISDSQHLNFLGDYSSIQNVLMNICINSSHAMPEGGDIQITTELMTLEKIYCESSQFDLIPGDYIGISIIDSGCGIPDENLDYIFDPFFTTKEVGKGTGLGLAAAYGIIKDHHGEIIIKSKINIGTTLQINLPVTEISILPIEGTVPVSKGTGTVLLVDDEDYNRDLGKDVLEHLGYNVLLADNGQSAIEIFHQKYTEIDVVIMDMIMPVMNGSDAAIRMKEIDENCIIIIASGYTNDKSSEELKRSGITSFIHKPYNISELSQLLKELL